MKAIIYEGKRNAKRIKFHIPYQAVEWRTQIKAMDTSFYHPQQRLWSILNSDIHLTQLKTILQHSYVMQAAQTHPNMPSVELSETAQDTLSIYEQKIILKAYSLSTIRQYKSAFVHYLSFFKNQPIDQITKSEIEAYLHHLISKYKISHSKQNLVINAIKLYYEAVLGRDREYYDIQRPKRNKTIPNVLSATEIKALITAPTNIKHKCILTIIYSAGLRLGEVTRLRIEDIHSEEGYIFIKGGKGKKDRRTILSERLLPLLREYYKQYRPAYWLFEGQDGGQYSASSVTKVFRKAVKQSKINPWATVHTLRHSFATHLMTSGTNLRYVQSLLGHNSPKTTEIYTHVININNKTVRSPLDNILNLGNQTEGHK